VKRVLNQSVYDINHCKHSRDRVLFLKLQSNSHIRKIGVQDDGRSMKYIQLMRRAILVALLVTCHLNANAAQNGFIGDAELETVEDSFVVEYKTKNELIYHQSNGRVWIVPAYSVIDGRGFPKLYTDVYGQALESEYIKSAIFYDYAVKSKHHPWRAAQEMLYEGMQLESASRANANVVLMLLRATGTRWAHDGPNNCFSRCHGPDAKLEWRPVVDDRDVIGLIKWAHDESLTIEDIEERVKTVILEEGPHSSIGIR